MSHEAHRFIAEVAGAIGLVTLALAIYSGWRRAALAGGRVGTSAGAAPGFVRLPGTVRPVGEVLKSPWSKAECVWYRVVTSVPRTGATIHVGGNRKDRGLDDDRRQIVAQAASRSGEGRAGAGWRAPDPGVE